MGVSNFDYHVNRAENAFDVRQRKIMKGESIDNTTDVESWSADKIKAALEKVARSNAEQAAMDQSKKDADVFVKLHPEFVDSEDNALAVRSHAVAAFNTPHPNLQQLEGAYFALRANGLVALNQKELAKQADAAAEKQAAKIREEAFDEDAAYKLPMMELHRRAMGWK